LCVIVYVRVEGVHAIIVTDREGVPLLQGAFSHILQQSVLHVVESA